VLSIGLSVWLTIKFGLSLSLSDSMATTVCIGIVWELAKYLFASEGWRLVTGFRPRDIMSGVGLLLIAVILTAGSVMASVAATDGVRVAEQAKGGRDALQDKIRAQISDEIAILLQSSKDDIANGYRERARVTSDRIQSLRDDLKGMGDVHAPDVNSPILSRSLVGNTPVWWVCCVVIGIMIEIISVVSVIILGNSHSSSSSILVAADSGSSPPSSLESERDGEDHRNIHKSIAARKLKPRYQDIMCFGNGYSQNEAKEILKEAESHGLIVRKGRSWAYA